MIIIRKTGNTPQGVIEFTSIAQCRLKSKGLLHLCRPVEADEQSILIMEEDIFKHVYHQFLFSMSYSYYCRLDIRRDRPVFIASIEPKKMKLLFDGLTNELDEDVRIGNNGCLSSQTWSILFFSSAEAKLFHIPFPAPKEPDMLNVLRLVRLMISFNGMLIRLSPYWFLRLLMRYLPIIIFSLAFGGFYL